MRVTARLTWFLSTQLAGCRSEATVLNYTENNTSIIPYSKSLANSSVPVPFFLYRNPIVGSSVADPGCLSRIRILSIPDSGSEFFYPGSASKNLSILTQEIVSQRSEIWSRPFIPDPDPDFLPIPDPGSRGQKGYGSRLRIRKTGRISFCLSVMVISSFSPGSNREVLYNKKLINREVVYGSS